MRSITQNQAVKWLDRLRSKNTNAYNDVIKALKKYDKNQNEHDCYLALNRTLFKESELSQELNNYLEGQNKFAFETPHELKLNSMMKKVKQQNRVAYQKIIEIVQMLGKEQNQASNNGKDNFEDLPSMIAYIVGKLDDNEQELKELIIRELETQTVDEAINKKNLEYLKTNKNQRFPVPPPIPEGDQPRKKVKKDIYYTEIPTLPNRAVKGKETNEVKHHRKYFLINSLTNVVEEKSFLKKIQRSSTPQEYNYLIKIIKLYYCCVISKEQAISFIENIPAFRQDCEGLSYMINSRETERRRFSVFKPLSDATFEDAERTTFSYIPMPITYPAHSSTRTEQQKKLLNTRWVSVPFGSQDQFNIRMKNPFEYNLLKNQDEIYEFDLYVNKLKAGLKVIRSLMRKTESSTKQSCSSIAQEQKLLMNLGILQVIYKNANREQKQQLQYFCKVLSLDTYKTLEARCLWQIDQLNSIRDNFASNRWQEVGEKNYEKALNIKSFEFKRFQKERLKATTMISELTQRYTGKIKSKKGVSWSFGNESQWEILNTFEPVAKSEKYTHRKYPTLDEDITKHKNEEVFAKFLPAMIMSFEDKNILPVAISYIWDYLEQAINSENQKEKSKRCFINILQSFFNFNFLPQHQKKLRQVFSDQKLGEFLTLENQNRLNQMKTEDFWIFYGVPDSSKAKDTSPEKMEKLPFFNAIKEAKKNPAYQCLPVKKEQNIVFFGHENFYVFMRLFYTIYERLIKAEELCNNENKFKIFQIFLHSSIKSKQTVKFEESMSLFFNEKAYLLTSIHRIVEQLLKILQNLSTCPIINESWKLMNLECEDIYFFLLSKQCKVLSKPTKILRFVFEKGTGLLYINMLNGAIMEAEENIASKEAAEIKYDCDQLVEDYSVLPVEGLDSEMEKKNLTKNEMEYIVDSSIRLLPCDEKEDIIVSIEKNSPSSKVKEINTLLERLQGIEPEKEQE